MCAQPRLWGRKHVEICKRQLINEHHQNYNTKVVEHVNISTPHEMKKAITKTKKKITILKIISHNLSLSLDKFEQVKSPGKRSAGSI